MPTAVSADLYVEILQFYARQMRLLDALELDSYVATFTEDGLTHHLHHGQKLAGRTAILEHARQALPRYAGLAVRHWNDHYQIEPEPDGTLNVTYCSLVTRTDAQGTVTVEPTFFITDVLVRGDDGWQARSRTIARDQPA